MPDFSIEQRFQGIVAGVDEAGRGPWAGSVVAAAAILDQNNLPEGINDSKKLTAKRREALYQPILDNHKIGVGIATCQEIDASNILAATKLAMFRAVENLPIKSDTVLVDGNQTPQMPHQCNIQTVIKGDSKSLSIAAASIIAKVTRDRMMAELHVEFPQYGWERNMGYGTKEHMQALEKYGITPHHRKSFAPVRKIMELMSA